MSVIPARELRNNVSDVLRRAEAGEEMTVTVSGRPVARVGPLSRRRASIPWEELVRRVSAQRPDPGMVELLDELRAETTDDMKDPWA